MLDLKRHILNAAISALASPFLQQVFADFITVQGSLLVLHSGDFGINQRLRVELDEFQAELCNGCDFLQSADPGCNIRDPAQQTRRQPAFRSAAVIKSGWPVACLVRAPRLRCWRRANKRSWIC